MINESIAKLVKYGENAGLVSGLDKIYATNRILEVMQISDYEEPEQIPETPDLEETSMNCLMMQLSAVFSNTTASFTAICSIRN